MNLHTSNLGTHGVPNKAVGHQHSPGMVLFLFLVLTVSLTWPAWINGGPLVFYDTEGYYNGGLKAFQFALSRVQEIGVGSGAQTLPVEAPDEGVRNVRSIPYGVFIYLTSQTPISLWGVAIAQALIMGVVVSALIRLKSLPVDKVGLFVALGAVTTLPWYVPYLVPDVLAAVPILVAVIAVRDHSELSILKGLLLATLTTFAALAHYGHIPLALGIGVIALALIALHTRRVLLHAALLVGPVVVAVLLNGAMSSLAFGEASAVPKRLPILLARSIEDGPALWHLQEECDERNYAVCQVMDGAPSAANEFLFGAEGLKRASDELYERIRDEETLVLWNSFVEYPFAQIWSLTGNAVKQSWTIGMSEIRWGLLEFTESGELEEDMPPPGERELLEAFEVLHAVVVVGSLLALAWILVSRRSRVSRTHIEMLIVIILGLALNAAIFGGLSAPADRYQARVIWIIPFIVIYLLFETGGRRSGNGS